MLTLEGQMNSNDNQVWPCRWHSGLEARIKSGEKRLDELEHAIVDIRDRLLYRPSWVTLAVITILSSLVTALAARLIGG